MKQIGKIGKSLFWVAMVSILGVIFSLLGKHSSAVSVYDLCLVSLSLVSAIAYIVGVVLAYVTYLLIGKKATTYKKQDN